MYINSVVSGKRTLGSISCNTTTSRSLWLIPLNWVPLELLQDSDSSLATIGPHWPSSYPEYLSPHQGKDEQQRIVWVRLLNQRSNLAKSLREQKERYHALRRELNPRTTQVESSHNPLYRDMYSTYNVVTAINNIDKLHMYLLHYNRSHGCLFPQWTPGILNLQHNAAEYLEATNSYGLQAVASTCEPYPELWFMWGMWPILMYPGLLTSCWLYMYGPYCNQN